ncbi:MAG: metal-dependent hydrolase [Candidatus Doudnabacteria bacterium]
MDIFAHGLWTNAMYKAIPETRKDRKATSWGIFFGIFPDLFAFTPVFAYIFYEALFVSHSFRLVSPQDAPGPLPLDGLTHHLYNFSHSLVIWAVVCLVIWIMFRKFPWVLLGWALHICIDIFTHSSKFYPTPFLFPVSEFYINGWPWVEPVFMLVNYGLLLVLYLFVIPKLKSKFVK